MLFSLFRSDKWSKSLKILTYKLQTGSWRIEKLEKTGSIFPKPTITAIDLFFIHKNLRLQMLLNVQRILEEKFITLLRSCKTCERLHQIQAQIVTNGLEHNDFACTEFNLTSLKKVYGVSLDSLIVVLLFLVFLVPFINTFLFYLKKMSFHIYWEEQSLLNKCMIIDIVVSLTWKFHGESGFWRVRV
jgi:hypothetical protein